MKAAQNLGEQAQNAFYTHPVEISSIVEAKPLIIGEGFKASTFRESDFKGAMDPLVMVDHYTMTEPTFGAHPHAGLSAVSVIFEDSSGKFHNRDSLGNDFDLEPGDLYWLKAGAGVVHDEAPRKGANIHGLQVFVNLPASLKKSEPESLHIHAKDIPIYQHNGARVRIILGESNGTTAQKAPALPMTILDASLETQSHVSHTLKAAENAWLYAVKGSMEIQVDDQSIHISSGQAIAIENNKLQEHTIRLSNTSSKTSQFALFSGEPIKEPFVQQGPFIMSTETEIQQVQADYQAGKLGQLDTQ